MSIFKEIAGVPKLSFFIWAILLAGLTLNLTSLVSVSWMDIMMTTEDFNLTMAVGLWRVCFTPSIRDVDINTCVGIPNGAGAFMGGAQGVMATSNALAFTGLLVISAFIASKAYRTKRTTTLLTVSCTGAFIGNVICLGLMASNVVTSDLQLFGFVLSAKLSWAFPVACTSAGLFFISVLPSCFMVHKLQAPEVPFNRIA